MMFIVVAILIFNDGTITKQFDIKTYDNPDQCYERQKDIAQSFIDTEFLSEVRTGCILLPDKLT